MTKSNDTNTKEQQFFRQESCDKLAEALRAILNDGRTAIPLSLVIPAERALAAHEDSLRENAEQAAQAVPAGDAASVGADWTPCVKLPVTVHVRQQRLGETHISTREGITPVKPDDLIMRGVQGEEYPIGRAIFERTYRLCAAAPAAPAPEAQPQAQAAGQEPYTSERHFALREGHEHRAEEDYFSARMKFEDSIATRTAFYAGYVRGFDKGTELADARAALAQRQPLTDEHALSLWKDAHWKWEVNALAFARAIEAACAEAWGVKLAGATTGEQR